MNTMAASTTPEIDRLPRLARRYQAHKPDAGRKESNDVLLSAARPQSKPNCSHGSKPSRSSNVRVNQKMVAMSRAARLVSQMARVHQNITLGSKAHAQADPTTTFSEKIRRAIRKIGMHVSAENRLFTVSSTKAAAVE